MTRNGHNAASQQPKLHSQIPQLATKLQNSQGFSLHFICCDQDDCTKLIRNEFLKNGMSTLSSIDLPAGKEPVRFLLEALSSEDSGNTVLVTGFKKFLPPATDKPPDEFLELLNWELFELKRYGCALIFVLPVDLLGPFQENATDLWELTGGFYGLEPIAQNRHRTDYLLCDYFSEVCGDASFQQRLNRITYYRTLEQQPHPNGTLDSVRYRYDLLGKLAVLHYRLGAFMTSVNYLEEQMQVALELDDAVLLPEIFNNLGMVNEAMGNYQDAFDYIQTAWEKADAALKGNNHPAKALILCNLSNILCSLGHYQEAFLNCRQAVRMCENKLGMRHPRLVPILVNFARVLTHQNMLDEALDNYRRALQIVEKKLDLEHPYVTIILQNIGLIYFKQSKPDSARRYFYRTLEMTEKVLGPEHPYLAVQLNNTGLVHLDVENSGRALKYFSWALEMRKTMVGQQDPIVADILRNISLVHELREDFAEAQNYQKQALDIYRLKLPFDHPFIAETEVRIHELEEMLA